jgi:hypothetical protein
MDRQTKTTTELIIIVMGEIGLHEELQEIKGVTIRKTGRRNAEAANWDAVFETLQYSKDKRPIPMPITHPLADQIVQKLQSQYDAC